MNVGELHAVARPYQSEELVAVGSLRPMESGADEVRKLPQLANDTSPETVERVGRVAAARADRHGETEVRLERRRQLERALLGHGAGAFLPLVITSSAEIRKRYRRALVGFIFRFVLWHSIALASIVGLIVMAYAYVFTGAIPK